MAVVMATTCDLATTINKASHAVVTHTPPPTSSIIVVDATIRNTGRSKMAAELFMATNTHQGR